jgi:flagellar secretion chaperone FliS
MWQASYLDTRVLSADPLELVHILYEHTMMMVADARRHLSQGNIAERGHSISRAIAAIDQLNSSLDRVSGGPLVKNLAALYTYMRGRLIAANIRQEDAPLAEVESLLKTLGEAWSAIRPAAQAETGQFAVGQRGFGAMAAEAHAEYECAGQGWSA